MSYKLIKNHKTFQDRIHGFIKATDLACTIIDTSFFQRLRDLHQLGTCHYAFHSATHTRFEHSLGTYYLAGKLLDNIINNSDMDKIDSYLSVVPELGEYYKSIDKNSRRLDEYVCELVKIAALCHDIGHGPFSHVFDDIFIPCIKSSKKETDLQHHENRSLQIVEYLLKDHPIIKKDEIKFIQTLINPGDDRKGFIYQIVSNNLNSIDVDKYDYMSRDTKNLNLQFKFDSDMLMDGVSVIDDIICFPEKICFEVASIFDTRYRLHKQIYGNKTVVAIQFMIKDIMLLLDDILGLYDSIFDVNSFCDLTDGYIMESIKPLMKNIKKYTEDEQKRIIKANSILSDIKNRKLYRLITSTVSKNELPVKQMDLFDKDKIFIYCAKIGFVSGKKKNPLDSLYFYKRKDPGVCYKIEKEKISALLPDKYQEYIYMIFTKDRTDASYDDKIIHQLNKLI